MITKIGVICQDRNSFGFLKGLKDRLGCQAKLVEPRTPMGKTQRLLRKHAILAWREFQNEGVDLIVRFTDADQDRWQDILRYEREVIPPEAESIWVCGVSVNSPEEWIALDPGYLADNLGLDHGELTQKQHRTDRIKSALIRARSEDEAQSNVVARLVSEAPRRVFRRWLDNDTLRIFYGECRRAAIQADCDVPNELDDQ